MIIDDLLEFCDATALNTGGAASYLIGSQVDLGDIGLTELGEDLELVISVDTAVDSAGDGVKVQFHLASDDTASIATNGSATYHWSSPAIAQATLVAGYQLRVPLPKSNPAYEQFIGILQTTSVEAVTAGKVNAFICKAGAAWKAFDAPGQV